MATPNSSDQSPDGPAVATGSRGRAARLPCALWCALGLALAGSIRGTDTPAGESFADRAERLLREAARKYADRPADPTVAWQFARACFDRAEFSASDAERAALAQRGIPVARALVREHPKLAPAHYYLAMNLGQLARTRLLGALPLVSEMEDLFQEARTLDPGFDYAGPDRCLGLLYRDAPGWPVSVGSKAKARRHLRRAVEVSPEYPGNRLNLIESLLDWEEAKAADEEIRAAEPLFPKAKETFKGEEWASSWAEWDPRWRAILKRVQRDPMAATAAPK